MKWLRQLRVWLKRRKEEHPNPLPALPFRQDVETQILPYEIHSGSFVIEYRRPGQTVWIRLTHSYTRTENPRHWSLTHPWQFATFEEASVVAGSMDSAWITRHLTLDRERYHDLKIEKENALRLKRRGAAS